MKKPKSKIEPPKSIYTKNVPSTTFKEFILLFFVGIIIFIITHN